MGDIGVSLCGITAYGTCGYNGAAASVAVDDVISGDVVNVEMVAAALVSTVWVEVCGGGERIAGVIGACDGGIKGCICGEVRTRDVDGEVVAESTVPECWCR